MLLYFKSAFDYTCFENKLKHYFSDTAPIFASIELRLNEVFITSATSKDSERKTITVILDNTASVQENIKKIIQCCETYIYPKMVLVEDLPVSMTDNQKILLLYAGYQINQIHGKQLRKIVKQYTITRFNTRKNTIDYRDDVTNKTYRAHFKRPLVISRDSIIELGYGERDAMQELYRLITENSRIEELEEKE